jgi:hypothetical protein
MRIRIAVLLCSFLLVCSAGSSQNRLGDVAGAIKLNPEAIVEQKGFVEDPNAGKMEDQELLAATLEASSIIADSVGALVDEARATVLYEESDVPRRLRAAALDLDTEIQEIYLLRLNDLFARPLATARDAADACAAADESIRGELAHKGIAFTQAKEAIARCRKGLDQAEAELSAILESPDGKAVLATSETDGPAAAPTDDEIIAEICQPEGADANDVFDACSNRQYQAVAALDSRTWENEQLDAGVFADIRAICLELNPRDFALRNECEVEKMTATRLETE